MIPLTRLLLGAEEQAGLARALASGMLVQSARVAQFEGELAAYTGRRHGIAVSNGTTALELALRALGIGAGDHVLCPDLTWPSPAHAIVACGAVPVLVDVDAAEWNAGPLQFRAALDRKPKAVIVIEQFGNPARVPEIAAALPGVPLILDSACSIGSRLGAEPCGKSGVIACTSFHPRKVITTGEGGMCLTDDDALAERLRILRNHGQSGPGRFACASGNHRLSELAAVVGSAQMARLTGILEARRACGARYLERLRALPLTLPASAPNATPNYQTFGVLLPEHVQRERVIETLAARGVQSGALSYALHRLPHLATYAAEAAAQGRSLATSASIAARGLALPLFPGLTHAEQDQVIAALSAALS